MFRHFVGLSLLCALLNAQQPPSPPIPTEQQRQQIVQIEHIVANGSRLPIFSIIKVIGVKAGDKVNDSAVNSACHRLQSTGLIKSVDYQYLMYPDKPGVTTGVCRAAYSGRNARGSL